MQMPLREAPTSSIQKFNIWEKQTKQISKKNHQLSWKSWNYHIHTQHRRGKSPTRVPSTTKQTSTDRDKEIEDLRNQIKLLKQNQKERDTQEQPKHTENKKNIPSQKTSRWSPPQEAILKPISIC